MCTPLTDPVSNLVFFVALALLVGIWHLLPRKQPTYWHRYHLGYAEGLAACDHPTDRAEAQAEIEATLAKRPQDPFALGMQAALTNNPHGLPR